MMEGKVLLGRGKELHAIPQAIWEHHLDPSPQHVQQKLGFMTGQHHQVRNFVVRELLKRGKPINPEDISDALEMPPARLSAVLDELERKLFFLVRDPQGAVAWAYPVTVEPTPHLLNFSTGEQCYGA